MNQEQHSLFRNKVLKSFVWLSTGTFSGQLISWLSTIIVIRLLAPSDYGLMAMSYVLIAFLTMISEMGMSSAIIQSEKINDYEIRQVYGLIIVTNLAGMVVSYFLAPFIAVFFKEESLVPLIRVLSINFILISLYSVQQATFIRELNFHTKAKIDIISQIGTSVITLTLAIKGMGVWALVAGAISLHFLRAIGFNIADGRIILPAFSYRGAERLVKFGLTITGDRFFYYLYEESDKVIVGRFLGNTLLGTYAVALNLSSMVMNKVLPIITQVTFTAYSRIQDDIERIGNNVLKTTHAVAFLGFPLFWGMAGAAPEAIGLILGPKWVAITLPFQLFCLIMPLKALSVLLPPAVQAIGKPKINLVNMAITFVTMTIAFLIGVREGGIIGVTLAWVTVYPIVFVITTLRCLKALRISVGRYLAEVRFSCIASAIMITLIYIFRKALIYSFQPLPSLLLTVLVAALFYLGFVMIFKKEDYSRLRALLQR